MKRRKMSEIFVTSETCNDHAHDHDPDLLLIRLRAAAHEVQERLFGGFKPGWWGYLPARKAVPGWPLVFSTGV
jgi:hypothetical protein